jgi:hypothetical protein
MPEPTETRREIAQAVADETAMLARRAREVGLDVLAHLLDHARLEAAERALRG